MSFTWMSDLAFRKRLGENADAFLREVVYNNLVRIKIMSIVALAEVKTLGGLLPICASCKKIRDDKGYWQQIESYISEHSSAEFSHSLCPDCIKKLYPELGYGKDDEPSDPNHER